MADPFNPFLPGQASDQLTAYTRSQAAAQQAAASLGRGGGDINDGARPRHGRRSRGSAAPT